MIYDIYKQEPSEITVEPLHVPRLSLRRGEQIALGMDITVPSSSGMEPINITFVPEKKVILFHLKRQP